MRRHCTGGYHVSTTDTLPMASLTRYSKGYKIHYRVYYPDGTDRLAFADRYCFRSRDAPTWFPLLPGRKSLTALRC